MADFGLAAQIGRGGGGGNAMAQPADPANQMMRMLQLQQLQQNMMLAREQEAREAALAPLRRQNLETDIRGSAARAAVAETQGQMLRTEREDQLRKARVNRGMIDVMDRADRGLLDLSSSEGLSSITDPEIRSAVRSQLTAAREAADKAQKANLEMTGVQRAIAYNFVDRYGEGITGPRQYQAARDKILKVDPTAAEFLPDNYNVDNASRLRDFVRERKTSIKMIGDVPVMVTEGSPVATELTIQRAAPAAPPPPPAFGNMPSFQSSRMAPDMAAGVAAATPNYADAGQGIIGQRLPAATEPQVSPTARSAALPASQFTADLAQQAIQQEAEKTRARETAKSEVVSEERRRGAGEVLKALNDAKLEDLISQSTSGIVQRTLAGVPGAFGTATPGMQKIGQLETIGGDLALRLLSGKLGGGTSDNDVKLVQSTLADIANPDKPANQRLAAFRQLKQNLKSLSEGKEITVATPTRGAQLNAQDRQALSWANSNPNDPRAALIKQRLGVQ